MRGYGDVSALSSRNATAAAKHQRRGRRENRGKLGSVALGPRQAVWAFTCGDARCDFQFVKINYGNSVVASEGYVGDIVRRELSGCRRGRGLR